MYEELKARLRSYLPLGDGSLWSESSKDITRSIEAIEQLERQLAERDAEIAKYLDAPVVAYVNFADNGNIRIWTSASDHAMHIAEDQGFVLQHLIVKPGEQ